MLSDRQIRQRLQLPVSDPRHMVISPFSETTSEPGIVSYGLTSFGYDIRLSDKFIVFSNMFGAVVDPLTLRDEIEKRRNNGDAVDFRGNKCVIPPNSFVLAESMEFVRIPEDCLGVVLGKSTYARCAMNLNTTPLEPGWEGIITLEIANMSPLPAVVHANMGIGQIVFHRCVELCEVPYNRKKNSRYQGQIGVTPPIVS